MTVLYWAHFPFVLLLVLVAGLFGWVHWHARPEEPTA